MGIHQLPNATLLHSIGDLTWTWLYLYSLYIIGSETESMLALVPASSVVRGVHYWQPHSCPLSSSRPARSCRVPGAGGAGG